MNCKILIVIVVVGSQLTLIGTELSRANEPARKITVSAMSEFNVAPNEVILSLSVTNLDESLVAAKAENDERVRKILSLATNHQIEPKYFEIDYFNISARYEQRGAQRKREFVGYDVVRSIDITLQDFGKLEPLLSDALDAGANRVDGIHFRTTDHRRHQFEARRLAVLYAKEKAQHLAELNGLTLGKAIEIEEEVEGSDDTTSFGMGAFMSSRQSDGVPRFQLVGTAQVDKATQEKALPTAGEQPLAPGQITVSATVTITFELQLPKPEEEKSNGT